MKVIKRSLTLALLAAVAVTIYGYYSASTLPENYTVRAGQQVTLDNNLLTVTQDSEGGATPVNQGVTGNYKAQLKLFGIIPIREVNVDVIDSEVLVIPGGSSFGIKMLSEGVMVVGLGGVDTGGEMTNPAQDAGIKVGDIIIKMNGVIVQSNTEVKEIIASSAGNPVSVELRRKDQYFTVEMVPVCSGTDGNYRGGLWVRDSSAGIGTISFYDPQRCVFGGLGHAITDVDTGDIIPISSGEVVDVIIAGADKGVQGRAGELRGSFKNDLTVGLININEQTGVYGTMKQTPTKGQAIPLGLKQEISEGPATVRTTISVDGVDEFNIYIEKISLSETTKGMVVHITDERLLDATGGIVHGMSGSPIIQNGKLVGAITHVFVNDPTRGYAIFAENMYKTSMKVSPLSKSQQAA